MRRASVVLAAGIAAVTIACGGTSGAPLEDEGDGGGAADSERFLRASRALSAS